ncbi:MAG TPA: hypothetical protein VFI33_13245 [Puia sp.]|nr:hypothetical protein [Puia sp.]
MSEYADSLLAFKADIEHKGLLDWLEAHTSFMRPLHRYVGTLVVDTGSVSFSGEDSKAGSHFSLTITRSDITALHLGYDSIFRRIDDRSLGILHFVPLRIDFTQNKRDESIYIFANYSRLLRQSDNRQVYEELGGEK